MIARPLIMITFQTGESVRMRGWQRSTKIALAPTREAGRTGQVRGTGCRREDSNLVENRGDRAGHNEVLTRRDTEDRRRTDVGRLRPGGGRQPTVLSVLVR